MRPRRSEGAGLAPLHKPSPEDLLTVPEIVQVLMPLRDLRDFYAGRTPPNMLAVDIVERCMRRVAIGLVRLRADETVDVDLSGPQTFEVTTR